MTPEIIDRIEKQMGEAVLPPSPARPRVVKSEHATASQVHHRMEEIAKRLGDMGKAAGELAKRFAGPEMSGNVEALPGGLASDANDRTVFDSQMLGLDGIDKQADTLARQLERIVRSLG